MAEQSEALQTLKAMFEAWDDATLAQVLSASDNNVEAAVDAVLGAGTPEAWRGAQVALGAL